MSQELTGHRKEYKVKVMREVVGADGKAKPKKMTEKRQTFEHIRVSVVERGVYLMTADGSKLRQAGDVAACLRLDDPATPEVTGVPVVAVLVALADHVRRGKPVDAKVLKHIEAARDELVEGELARLEKEESA